MKQYYKCLKTLEKTEYTSDESSSTSIFSPKLPDDQGDVSDFAAPPPRQRTYSRGQKQTVKLHATLLDLNFYSDYRVEITSTQTC